MIEQDREQRAELALPPSLVGTSWDTPTGRAQYARIAEDPLTPEQLRTPIAWLRVATEAVSPDHGGDLYRVDAVARALAEAFAAGYDAGERNS